MEVSEKRMVTSQKIKRKYIVCTKKKERSYRILSKKEKNGSCVKNLYWCSCNAEDKYVPHFVLSER